MFTKCQTLAKEVIVKGFDRKKIKDEITKMRKNSFSELDYKELETLYNYLTSIKV